MPGSGSPDRLAETLAAFDRTADPGEPLSTPEVAAELDCDRRAAYDRLQGLVARGDLHSKKVGSRARVWWRPDRARPGDARPDRTQCRYRVAFDRSDAYLWLLDADGTLLDANDAALSGLGVDRADVVGEPFPETDWWSTSDADRSPVVDAVEQAHDGQRVRNQLTLDTDGGTVPVEFVVGPTGDDGDLLLAEGRPLDAAAGDAGDVLDVAVELDFRSDQLAGTFLAHANDAIELQSDTAVSLPDGTRRRYWTVTGMAPDTFRAVVEDLPTIRNSRLLRTVGDTSRFELAVEPDSIESVFDSFDGEFHAATLRGGEFRFRGRFQRTVEPDRVLASVREVFPDVELLEKRQVLTPAYFQQLVDERLTDRQRTVLKLAYAAGYYEQPRQSTGAQLADQLGITKQTFHHHLRNAEATVCGQVFKNATDPSV